MSGVGRKPDIQSGIIEAFIKSELTLRQPAIPRQGGCPEKGDVAVPAINWVLHIDVGFRNDNRRLVMSIHLTFPDVILYANGIIRLVTEDARSWAYSNTSLSQTHDSMNIPSIFRLEGVTTEELEHDGLFVRRVTTAPKN